MKVIEQPEYILREMDAGIIEAVFLPGFAGEDKSTGIAERIANDFNSLIADHGQEEVLLLVEPSEDPGKISSEAKKIYKTIMDDPRIQRMAIYGGAPEYFKVAVHLLSLVKRDNSIKVFRTKEEAMKWLIEPEHT